MKVIKVERVYFILFTLVCQFSYMKAYLCSVYFTSRGPIGNVLMQMSYEPLWTICVVCLRPLKLYAIFFHIIHLYFSSVQKLTDTNNAVVRFDKLMMHTFGFSLCFVSRLS